MVAWIKMALSIEVSLGPGNFVLDGDLAPFPKREWSPLSHFSAHCYCGQTDRCIKMPLGMEVGLSSGDFVLDEDPAPSPKREARPPIFGACLLWPNGWMDQDGTWHGGRPQPIRLFVLDEDPAPQKAG